MRGRAVIVVVHGSPEVPIVGNDRGKGGRGRSVADEKIMERAKTTATMERGMRVVLRRLWEGRFGRRRTTTKTTETSRDDEHEEDVVTLSMFETLCEGELSSSLSTARLKRQSSATTAARAGGADPLRTK